MGDLVFCKYPSSTIFSNQPDNLLKKYCAGIKENEHEPHLCYMCL